MKLELERNIDRKDAVELWVVDMANYQSVKAFCTRAGNLDRLDAAILNAGLATGQFELAEGMESTITVWPSRIQF